jgi:hypothetical protein
MAAKRYPSGLSRRLHSMNDAQQNITMDRLCRCPPDRIQRGAGSIDTHDDRTGCFSFRPQGLLNTSQRRFQASVRAPDRTLAFYRGGHD